MIWWIVVIILVLTAYCLAVAADKRRF